MTTLTQQHINQTMSLLTTTTGFVDVYVIEAFKQLPWLIPQSLILAALSAKAHMTEIEWRDTNLPILSLVDHQQEDPVALVVESYEQHRFALLIEKMPEAQRVRISSLHDAEKEMINGPFSFQIVELENKNYQVPDFEKINQTFFKAGIQTT